MKIVRRLLIALGILLALVLLAVGGGWIWVHSESGGAFIRSKALGLTKDMFAGTLEFGSIELTGTTVTIKDLKLYTPQPENELVLEVASVSAKVSLGALLRKTVLIKSVNVEAPKLYLKSDERGLNLSRAIAAKTPKTTPDAPSQPSALRIELEQLDLGDGFVSFDADDQHFAFEALGIKGNAGVSPSPLKLDSALTLEAKLIRPFVEPLSLTLKTSSPRGGALTGEVVLSLGQNHIEASGSWPDLTLKVKNTSIHSDTVKVFVPSWPLKPDVRLTADLTEGNGTVRVEAGHAQVDVDAAWAKDLSSVSKVSLQAKDVDLAELLGSGKHSRIELKATGSLSDVKKLTGQVKAEGSWTSPTSAKKLAELAIDATANNGEYWFKKLSVEVPGVSVGVNGKATLKMLNVSGVIDISDLSKLGPTVHEFTGASLPVMAGTGHLNVNALGSLTHPSVNATGALTGLKVAAVSAQSLDLDAHVPDVLRPLDSDGTVVAKQLKFGDNTLDEVKVSLVTRGRFVEAEVSTKGLGDLVLRLAGELDELQNSMALSALDVRSAEGTWSLEAPATITWSPMLKVDNVKLRSGEQRIEVSAAKRGSNIDAAVNIVSLDLAKLPRAAVPEKAGLAGLLTVNATATGHMPRPDIKAKVALSKGAAQGFDGIELQAAGEWKDRRAAGQFALDTPLAKAVGSVDLDIDAFVNERPAPLSAHVKITGIDLAKVAKFTKKNIPLEAQIVASIDVTGKADAPQVHVLVESDSVSTQIEGQPAIELTKVAIELVTRAKDELGATINANTFGGAIHVDLATPLTWNGLRKQLPTAKSIMSLPLTLTADVSAIALEQMHEAGLIGGGADTTGRLGMQARLTGSLDDPRATITVNATKVTYAPLEQAEATATLTADDKQAALSAKVFEKGQQLVQADGSLNAPLSRLQKIETLGAQTVKLVATLYPLELKTIAPAESTLAGTASATLTVDGTLDAPRYDFTGSVAQLAFAKAAMGSARFEVKGAGEKHVADITIGGLGQDDFKLHGEVGAQLGLASVRKGLEPAKFPVDVTVKSNNFDLSFFSGITPMIRVIGGKLSMNATMKGTIGSPKLEGDAKWAAGKLNLSGFGSYREIELEAKASNTFLTLEKFRAVSGAGWVTLSGGAVKAGDAWKLEAKGQTQKFPIVVDDQPVAIATLRFDTNGELTGSFLNIRAFNLPAARIDLPDVRRKDLQNLDRPKDVIVIRGGSGKDLAKRAREIAKKKEAAQEKGAAFTARALINAQQRIQIKSSDIDIELGLSDGFRLDYGNTVALYGEASVLRGKLSVIGRDFEVQRASQLRFAGAATEPYINVTAVYTNTKGGDETRVTVSVTGRGTDVSLKVSSDPPLSESEIYTLLATGRSTLTRGGGSAITATQAASVVGSVMLAQAKKFIAKEVPIDVIDVEAAENWESAKINVGKYLTDTLFLGYSLNPGADQARGQNPHTVKLEYQMTRAWSLEAAAGTAPAANADVIWSRDF